MNPYEDHETAKAMILADLEDQCAAPQPLPSGGLGGKPPSRARTRQRTIGTRTKDTSPSAGSATASGHGGRSSPPASGGSPAKSTLKPGNFSPTSAAAPKSMGNPSTRGALGHG